MKRTRPKRARSGERVSLVAAIAASHRWSMDFVHDQLVNGRCFRVLNMIDDFTREGVAVEIDTSISGHWVARVLDGLAKPRSLLKVDICYNGTKVTSKAM